MKNILDFCESVNLRAATIGLRPLTLSRRSGVSKSTVYEIQNGELNNLGLLKAVQLLSALGLQLTVTKIEPRLDSDQSALESACVFASKGQRKTMQVDYLKKVLSLDDLYLGDYSSDLKRLLSLGEIELLFALAGDLAGEFEVTEASIWNKMRNVAKKLKVSRDLWS